MQRLLFLLLFITSISCRSDFKSLKIKGSDTEVNLAVQIAESYHKLNQNQLVSVSGGGSGLGIAALLNGTTDIANSSRNIKNDELELFKKNGIDISSYIFAQDAIAFVVSSKLNIDSISTISLSKILNGHYTNWSGVSSQNIPINIYGRQSNSGTYEYVKSKLNIQFSPYAKQMNGNAQILEAIKVDSTGIGYVGAGYVMNQTDNGIKVLKIYSPTQKIAISPFNEEQIVLGKYFFQRPLYQFYKLADYDKIKEFLDFEASPEGIALIKSSGYYPVLKVNRSDEK